MKAKQFKELLASVKQAGEIMRLTAADAEVLAAALVSPPAPSERLIATMRRKGPVIYANAYELPRRRGVTSGMKKFLAELVEDLRFYLEWNLIDDLRTLFAFALIGAALTLGSLVALWVVK